MRPSTSVVVVALLACSSRGAIEPPGASHGTERKQDHQGEPDAGLSQDGSAGPSERDAGALRDGDAHDAAAAPGVSGGPRLVELGLRIQKVHKQRRLSWRQVETLNWQAVAEDLPPLPPQTTVKRTPEADAACPKDMALVAGNVLVDKSGKDDTDFVEYAQDTTCSEWRVPKRVCGVFDEEKWKVVSSAFPRKPVRVCMDTYEYPNRYGEFPLVVVTFSEAAGHCKREGKRLCTETEWTFACEGEAGLPYPYGYRRDSTACPIDRPRVEPPEDTFIPRTIGRTAWGIDQMWLGERSGAFAKCVSPLGIADMTGNVDEWTRSVRTWGYKMTLKGGFWSYVRGRCRPQTRGHGPRYVNVETGFRCCKDPGP